MNDNAATILHQLITSQGENLLDDARLCEALLKDFPVVGQRETYALVGAVREGIPKKLRQASTPLSLLLPQLDKQLLATMPLPDSWARFAVDTWVLALGVADWTQLAALRGTAGPPPPPPTKRKSPTALELMFGLLVVAGIGYGTWQFVSSPKPPTIAAIPPAPQPQPQPQPQPEAATPAPKLQLLPPQPAPAPPPQPVPLAPVLPAPPPTPMSDSATLGREAIAFVVAYYQDLNNRNGNAAMRKWRPPRSSVAKDAANFKSASVTSARVMYVDDSGAVVGITARTQAFDLPAEIYAGNVHLERSDGAWAITRLDLTLVEREPAPQDSPPPVQSPLQAVDAYYRALDHRDVDAVVSSWWSPPGDLGNRVRNTKYANLQERVLVGSDDRTAVVRISARTKAFDGSEQLWVGTVHLRKEGGKWLIAKQNLRKVGG